MVTRKQYPNHHIFETEIGGRTFTVETGKVAELADAECICRYGDTVVLSTITCNPIPKAGMDYFPLTIEFEERLYGVGRIPGSFNRREGRPSEKAILTMRLIDRPMRPFFDDELRNDVVITETAMAVDHDNPVEVVASLGAFIATACSSVPWNGPMATTEVAYLDGEYIVNPSAEQRAAAQMFGTISSTAEKVVMIETEAKEVKEDVLLKGIELAHETNKQIVAFINSIVEVIGKPKFTFEKAAVNHELLDDLCAYGMDQIEFALDTDDKNVREERLTAARLDFAEKFAEKYEDFEENIEVCLYKMQKKVVKKWLLAGKRVDGRGMDDIRPLDAQVAVLPRVHGSGLFTRGQTQVLSVCTLATMSMEQKLDTIFPEEGKRYIHHYNFPAYSTGEARAARSTSRREIGHGALAEKALIPVLPSLDEFPYCIRVVSEVLSSNGSTSQGSICGSTLALMDAGVPIKRPVAGISCGLISDKETGEWRTFTDIQGVEDFHGEMDFKVAGTTEGVTAIQMDLKNDGL
ncbi:MAG: polyribonucleotide nucleotidyltransferase, partial [Oscillospiraceae bacterium]|nr:polyribonucleotide nucleotidyltransferase [Oscillospiraceae bacterium]